ncbi:MAG: phage tail tape measure protein, partial [Allobaculum sp.]|nr:phage tail tape measure protein [Allobaculum sp.]
FFQAEHGILHSSTSRALGDVYNRQGQTVTDKLTTPIVDFGKSAVETTMNFDATMSEVAAIAGATGSDLEDLRAKAKEMGATTKFSASEAAEAMTYMGMAGWDTTQILGGIPGIMNLASASGTDLATTSDIVTDALTALGMEAEDAGHFADVLAAASSGANTNVELLGESFKYVAPLAGTMHYSIEDLAIALGTMANSGIKASQGGTALANVITRMVTLPEEAETAMNALGLSLIDNDGNMKSLRQTMDDLREAFKDCNIDVETYNQGLESLDEQYNNSEITLEKYEQGLDDLTDAAFGNADAHAAQYAKMLAGQRGMPGLLAIIGASEEEYQKLTEAIDTASDSFEYNGQVFEGQAAKMSAVMLDNLKGDSTILQ